MLILGHMGIGSRLTRIFNHDFPLLWIYLGAALPDLIDKPLYYLMSWLTGQSGADLGLISSTRTFGHSGILLLLINLLVLTGSVRFIALSLGMVSHVLLDVVGDSWELFDASATVQALLFPLLGFKFFVSPFHSAAEHLNSKFKPLLIAGEIVGAFLIALDLYQKWKKNDKLRQAK